MNQRSRARPPAAGQPQGRRRTVPSPGRAEPVRRRRPSSPGGPPSPEPPRTRSGAPPGAAGPPPPESGAVTGSAPGTAATDSAQAPPQHMPPPPSAPPAPMPPVSAATDVSPRVSGGHRPRADSPVPPPSAPAIGGGPPRGRQAGGSGRGAVRRPASARRSSATSGLTAPGAFVVATGATLLGGLLDEMVTDTLGWFFATVFLVACAVVAVKTRIRDLTAAVFAAPIAFALTVLVLSVVFPSENAESFVVRTGLDMFTALTFKAGVLWSGTVLAALIVLARRRADREAARRRAARGAREARETREARGARETRGARDSREPREPRTAGDPRDVRTPQPPAARDRAPGGQVSPGIHGPRESRDIRETPRER